MPDNTTTQTTPGVRPTITNPDGSQVTGGGKNGTLATADQRGIDALKPASYAAPVLTRRTRINP